jgi:hypothetical protein
LEGRLLRLVWALFLVLASRGCREPEISSSRWLRPESSGSTGQFCSLSQLAWYPLTQPISCSCVCRTCIGCWNSAEIKLCENSVTKVGDRHTLISFRVIVTCPQDNGLSIQGHMPSKERRLVYLRKQHSPSIDGFNQNSIVSY